MSGFFSGLGVVIGLELRQRVRGVAWYVLLGLFFVLVGIVTVLLGIVSGSWNRADGTPGAGGWLFSLIVYFVLLLGTLVVPALSGNAINGDRDAGTLATTQVTLISSGQLVLGKFVAAWVSSLAFLAVALPFIGVAVAMGGLPPVTMLVDALVLAVELGVIAAIGVGLSGVLSRPIFSIVTTYLVIAALSLGTLITFGLLGSANSSTVHMTYIAVQRDDNGTPKTDSTGQILCDVPQHSTYQTPRFDRVWGVLAANPYVVMADASPASFDVSGQPTDLFSAISFAVRSAQHAPELNQVQNECAAVRHGTSDGLKQQTPRQVYDASTPSWFVGLGIHLVLGIGLLLWTWRRTLTPARRLPRGSRVA